MQASASACDPCTAVSLRCLIVDDNPRFGDEARSLLEQEGVSVVGVAMSGDEGLRLADVLAPDIALVDIHLAAESGFDVAGRLVNGSEALAVIFISTHDEQEFGDRIAASPALGFIPKARLSVEAIRQVLSG